MGAQAGQACHFQRHAINGKFVSVRANACLRRKSSKCVQGGEPSEFGVSNLGLTGDPQFSARTSVSHGAPPNAVRAIFGMPSDSSCIAQHWGHCRGYSSRSAQALLRQRGLTLGGSRQRRERDSRTRPSPGRCEPAGGRRPAPGGSRSCPRSPGTAPAP